MLNAARPTATESMRPQVGLSYKQVINDTIASVSWAASGSTKDLTLTYTPSAAMLALFDEYKVLSARIRWTFTPTALTDLSYGQAFAMCFDPSGSAAVTTYATTLAYRNSVNMYPSVMKPVHEYLIRRCTHLSSDGATLLSESLKTDVAWTAGHCYLTPTSALTASFSFAIEYEVEFSKPRSA
jgi:hypothetical protein